MTKVQTMAERNEKKRLGGVEGWGQVAMRTIYRADINCVVIINQLRGLAIWRGHRVTQTFRSGH